MAQSQIFRDYELNFIDNNGNIVVALNNDHQQGIGLRVIFHINLVPAGEASLNAADAAFQPSFFRIFNMSNETHALLNNGTLQYVTFSAGYRDAIQGGNTNKAVIIRKATIINAASFRQGNDIVTDIYTLANKTEMSKMLEDNDLSRYKANSVKKMYFKPKQVFTELIKKYLPEVTIVDTNLAGFQTKYNTQKDNKAGFIFSKGTTIADALSQVAGYRRWQIDSRGIVHVWTPGSNTDGIDNLTYGEAVEVNQSTGLLGIPILNAAGKLTAKTLLNPAITPQTVVAVNSIAGFVRTSAFIRTTPTIATKSFVNYVLKASLIGDSRGSDWITEFTSVDSRLTVNKGGNNGNQR